MTPEIDIANYLGQVVSSLTLDTNLFYGAVYPVEEDVVPALCVFVILTGGQEPVPLVGSAGPSYSEKRASIQVFVRGNVDAYGEAVALARTVSTALSFKPITGYANCKPLQPSPIMLGLDEDKHPMLSMNFEVMYYE